MTQKPFVIVGMSGGVDSSVTALRLLEQGYRVEGLFMKNWEETDDVAYCTAQEDMEDAIDVCETLDIPLHQVNFSKQYWDRVFRYFLDEYKAGRTPNPDVMCNKEIKFSAFLNYALKLGADKIATGHYCRLDTQNNSVQLLKGLDNNKDQSYFLHRLGQKELQSSLFPIGSMQKSEVRTIATEAGFVNHEKKDSTGICFIGERRFRDFLSKFLPAQKGPIKNLDGETIGEHSGSMYYTVGQRQGLGIGGIANTDEAPWFVTKTDVSTNTVYVVQGQQHPALYKTALIASDLHWVAEKERALPLKCKAKIRYRQDDQECLLTKQNEHDYRVEFTQQQRAVTSGQSIVFYQDDICLGGATIKAAIE